MTRRIGVINTGASTLKLALVDIDGDGVREVRRVEQEWTGDRDATATLRAALDALGEVPDVFGHRVVHGGSELIEPTTLTPAVERAIESLVELAPLHNATALAAMRALHSTHPQCTSVAVFDTAFHAHRPDESMRYALPQELVERFQIRRFGFHGLAHESLVEGLARASGAPVDAVDAITLQLGAGCSACAVRGGCSIETSMGYTPLEGLVMGSRSGDIDPAIVLRLVREGFTPDDIERDLTQHSGLEALCGLSDVRRILAAESDGHEPARLALALFCHRIVLTVGAYLTLLRGIGALVFGGGIGANSPEIRARVASGLAAWNVALDAQRNEANEPGLISAKGSRPVYALRTNEAAVIARAVARHLGVSH